MHLSTLVKGVSALLFACTLTCMSVFTAGAQGKVSVRGVIKDDAGEPLPGASVIVKGTAIGVNADLDGNYEISALATDVLEFSFLGYVSQEETVGSRRVINVVLNADVDILNEAVAIGYGSTRKQDLSMAVTQMNVGEALKSRAGDIATVLQGAMPGVTVQQTGDPMQSASYSIRGRGSKGEDGDYNSGNGVLFVVDGVPNAPYNVEDIETITVLKDAASAAIYGAQVGAGGVVLITTRKPVAGKVSVSANVSYGLERVGHVITTTTAEQFNETWRRASEEAGRALPDAMNPDVYAWGNTTRTNWMDEIFRTGNRRHYAVSVAGGSERINSVFSAAYDAREGVLLNTFSRNFTTKLQTNFNITGWLKAYERITLQISNGQGNVATDHEGPFTAALWYPRSATVYETNEDGTLALDDEGNPFFGGVSPRWATPGSGVQRVYNPVAYLTRLHRLYPENKVFSTTGIEIKPISSLTLRSDFTIDFDRSEADIFNAKMEELGMQRLSNSREQFFYNNRHWLSETTLTWAEVFGKHHISAMGGFTADYKYFDTRRLTSQDYAYEEPNRILWSMAGPNGRTMDETIKDYTMVSFIGRVGYSYDDRYFLVGSIRYDGSSRLPSEHRFDWFPSVSASWKLSSEPFFRDSAIKDYLNLVKFRAGWGKVGNVDLFPEDVASYNIINVYHPSTFGKNQDQILTGTLMDTIPNYDARWETTVQTSAGLDVNAFNNALELNVDWYRKETRDLIDRVPTAVQLGITTPPYGNMGKVLNTGWEFGAKYNGSAMGRKLTYSLFGNLALNHNEVLEYGTRQESVEHQTPTLNTVGSLLYSDAGQPWYSFKLYETDGIFRSQEDIDAYTYTDPETGVTNLIQPTAKPGDLKFKDTNDDGVINNLDRTFMGSYAPTTTYSFGGSLNCFGFDLSILFQGIAGNVIYNGFKQLGMTGRGEYGNLVTDVLDTWNYNPDSSVYPRLGLYTDDNGNYAKASDLFLEKGDYLRLKNVTLGYTLPVFKKYIRSIRLYVSGDNLLTFTKYSGNDPEVGNYGVDRGVYPVTRFYNFGVNINF
ncbi:MAG: TonB-dependent receptor [Bacteroidales bacterium]|nr:TonB-dependent receptor [Bacteroidales bacterium]